MAKEQQRVNTVIPARLDLPSSVYRFFLFRPAALRALIAIIHKAIFLISFVSLCLPIFVDCSAEALNTATEYPFVTLAKGSQSGVRERKFVVIKSESDWQALWSTHASLSVPPKKPPLVDFQTEMIVAVFAGEKSTGGYSIEITRIQEDTTKHALEFIVHESKPPPGAMVIQALTQPYHIVKLARIELPVTFVFQ
ncbi:MAG: protease complex subunit PrcB family protein [Alphaproteobacteria bacterium]